MLSVQDKQIATITLSNMVMLYKGKEWSQATFDGETKSYLQFLFNKGMTVDEMQELTLSAGLKLDVRIHQDILL